MDHKKSSIIGRQREIEELERAYSSSKSEFVAIFGRRRVGKTFLVKEVFGERIKFHSTGIYGATKSTQLAQFNVGLVRMTGQEQKAPVDWFIAFERLSKALDAMPQTEKKIVFLDELPWMETAKSNFLQALEYFWNNYAAWTHDILLVVCGSATSWLVKNLVNNHGGLHNRITHSIHLAPFNLYETELFLRSKNIKWNQYEIAQCYMTMGGIPYYLDYLIGDGSSLSKNIDNLFFRENGPLREEYERLFTSLFKNAKSHLRIVEKLATKAKGLTRREIIKATRMTDNGTLTERLKELISSGFIRKYQEWGKKEEDALFQLIDPYTLFYHQFIKNKMPAEGPCWQLMIDDPKKRAWSGYAFEILCLCHLGQLRKALGFASVSHDVYSWRSKKTEPGQGAQIDLVIQRRDPVIHLCEMKFSRSEFEIDMEYEQRLRRKIDAFQRATGTRDALLLTMITTYGVKANAHSGIVDMQATLADLFRGE